MDLAHRHILVAAIQRGLAELWGNTLIVWGSGHGVQGDLAGGSAESGRLGCLETQRWGVGWQVRSLILQLKWMCFGEEEPRSRQSRRFGTCQTCGFNVSRGVWHKFGKCKLQKLQEERNVLRKTPYKDGRGGAALRIGGFPNLVQVRHLPSHKSGLHVAD